MAVRFDADGEDYTRTTGLPSATTFTWTFWFAIDTDRNTFSTPVSVDAGTGSYVYLQTDNDGTTLKLWDSNGVQITIQNLTVGTWYFIAVSRNGTGANTSIYHAAATEAALTAQTGETVDVSFTATNLRIGASPFSNEWLNGRIAALKIWSGAALTQAEIENERFQYLPHRTANLHAFYPFLEGGAVAGAQQDFSGAGNTLTGGTNSATADGPPVAWRRGRSQIIVPAAAVAGNPRFGDLFFPMAGQ